MLAVTIDKTNLTKLVGKQIGIVGFGPRTGVALSRFLVQQGANLVLYDRQPAAKLQANLQQLLQSQEVRQADRELHIHKVFADNDFSWISHVDLLIASPGVPLSEPVFAATKAAGKPLVGEIEFSSWFLDAPIVAVTGTNGKTTTAGLIAQMLKNWNKRVFLGGNIGIPLVGAIGKNFDYVVVEVSSFQLETISSFCANISILLNVSEDHLDRHQSLANYRRLKGNIFLNQTSHHWAVVNADDATAMQLAASRPMRKLCFSTQTDNTAAVKLQAEDICLEFGDKKLHLQTQSCPLLGKHNRSNLMAMAAVGAILGVPVKVMQQTVDSAKPPPHRLERVAERDGVVYINDSKSTTVASTLQALCAFVQPLVLILGGSDKSAHYQMLRDGVTRTTRAIVAYGETAARMQQEIGFSGPFHTTSGFDDAVRTAMQMAKAGEIVLLSPAASSLDQFRDYVERGDRFTALVKGGVA